MIGKIALGLGVALTALAATGCSSVKVGPGEEAVLIQQPILFGSGGVVSTPVKTGRTYVAWTTKNVRVYMLPTLQHIEFDDITSMDNVALDFDAQIRVQVVDSVALVKTFGLNWFDSNLRTEIAMETRDAVKRHGWNQIVVDPAVTSQIDSQITAALEKYIRDTKLPVRLLSFTIGRANPPERIKDQRIATAEQEQRKLTEGQREQAEIVRLKAETAKANADNAYRTQMGLTPEQFVKLREIDAFSNTCSRNNCTIVASGTSVLANVR